MKMKNPNITKKTREKINHWSNKNNDFIDSINELNRFDMENLLKEGYPNSLNELLSEEEHEDVGDQDFEDLSDKFDEDMSIAFGTFYEKSNNQEILEVLASHLMFQKNDLALDFRKKYFAYTENQDIALTRAKSLFNESSNLIKEKNTWLKESLIEEKNNWLKGALYNSSNKFFDDFYNLYLKQKIREDELYSYLNALKGEVLFSKKYYNLDSWVKHYKNFFPQFVKFKLSRQNGYKIDFVGDVVFDLIKYPLEQFEKQKNITLIKPILDFLVEDFSAISGISKLEYIMVYLCYEKYKEKKFMLDQHAKEVTNNVNTIGASKSYRKLFVQHGLDSISLKLDKYIEKSIKENDPKETLALFKAIELPKEKYQVLDSYVSLALKLPDNIENLNKKLQKI